MSFIKKYSLPFVVFLTGACVLIIEVVATRILSPYYGNTIFTVSSVISVVLAALSAGYFFGGRLADKYPSEKIFYLIILSGGASVLLLWLLVRSFLPMIGYGFSLVSGPIISAFILFFLPSLLLGALSPFAVKLEAVRLAGRGVGSISGGIFFWSTLGSIFGSLSAGFVLIPRFGISRIVLSVAVTLIILGTAGYLLGLSVKAHKKEFIKIIAIIIVVMFLLGVVPLWKRNVVYSRDGIYERITIYDREYEGRPTRFFEQDRSGSGAMFLDSDELVYDYTKYCALYEVFKPDLKTALVIGGGAYSIPKAIIKDRPEAVVDVSEIEPSLFKLAKEYFAVPETDHIRNFTEDGRRLLHDSDKKYDMIFSDVYYSLYSIPAHFTTQEFFKIARDRLSADGIFVANLIGDLSRQEPSLLLSEIKTFQTVFLNSYFLAVDSPVKIGSQNIIFVGYNSEKIIDLSGSEISGHSNAIIRSLDEKNISLDRFEFSPYPILTDDYSPVEHLTADLVKKKTGQSGSVSGEEMIALIKQQLRYGPRYLSASGHEQTVKFLRAEMEALAEKTEIENWEHVGSDGQKYNLSNVIGRFWPENERRIILAAHYDSKKLADKDQKNPAAPVPGANDSGSGVAVLLELARVFANAKDAPAVGVDLIFFDGEEGEENIGADYSHWEPLGSVYFANHLNDFYGDNKPIAGIVFDMVCDRNLNIFKDKSSEKNAPELLEAFWGAAKTLNTTAFVDASGPDIRDDHTSLNQAGIPSILVIDFDYPYFHTSEDTPDKCSSESLETVARAALSYVYSLK